MTDSTTGKQPDITPEAPISKLRERRDSNDIIGRTKLLLPSLNGLEQIFSPPPSKEQPKVPTSTNRVRITATSAMPPTIQPPVKLFDTSEQVSERSQFFSSTTETGMSPVSAPIATYPDIHHSQPLHADNGTKNQISFFTKRRFFVFSGLLCALVIFAVFAYGYTHSSTNIQGQRATPLPMQTSHVQQGNTTAQGNNTTQGTKSFQVGNSPSITLQTGTGNVTVHAGSVGTVTVNGSNNGNNQGASSNSTSMHTTQASNGQGHDLISITTQPITQNSNYDITVPATTQMQVEATSGTITVDGISGLTIHTNSGNLDIGNVNGPINVYVTNGDITVHNVKGLMTMETVNGSIRGNTINGELKADTQNGDVVVQQVALSGQSILKTQYGSVRVTGMLDPNGIFTMGTRSGDVHLILPANTALQLQASTGSGSVHNAFGSNSMGSLPKAQIIVNIGSGSIIIDKGK